MRKKKKNKDIDPKNDKGQFHGYQEWYWFDNLWLRIVMKNNMDVGYEENHHNRKTIYHII